MILLPILTTSLIDILSLRGWESVLFELGSEEWIRGKRGTEGVGVK